MWTDGRDREKEAEFAEIFATKNALQLINKSSPVTLLPIGSSGGFLGAKET